MNVVIVDDQTSARTMLRHIIEDIAPQLAVLAAKESVNRAFEGSLSDGVMFERRLFHALFSTQDQKEGMDAFMNKRTANFTHQ